MNHPLIYSLAASGVSVSLEALFAGGGIKARLAELRVPRYAPPLWAWIVIGAFYYFICFVLLYRLFSMSETVPLRRWGAGIAWQFDVHQCALELFLLPHAQSVSCLCDWLALRSDRPRPLCPFAALRSHCGVLPVALSPLPLLRERIWIQRLETQSPTRRLTILLDECVPAQVRRAFAGHDTITVQEQGWTGIKNGALLAAAESAGFNLFVAADKNLRPQQNLAGRRLAILELWTNRQPTLDKYSALSARAAETLKAGEYSSLKSPP